MCYVSDITVVQRTFFVFHVKDSCLIQMGVLGSRFPYLLPSVCTSVFAVAVLIASFQLPVCTSRTEVLQFNAGLGFRFSGRPPFKELQFFFYHERPSIF
jgi:hypothetical protein